MTQESLDKTLGIIRHALTFAGGFFVTEGYITESALGTAIGAIATLVGIVWSVIDKKKRE